ncbi:MAG: ATP-dependent sacrificial sulfur transferase LarE [Phycisphaerae bacterium]|jgi:uncharacterized protein
MVSKKYENLTGILKDCGRLCVSFSGGVDSSFLAYAAAEALGRENVLLVYVKGVAGSAEQHKNAEKVAGELGLDLRVVEVNELEVPEVAASDERRCYFCKKNIVAHIRDVIEPLGFTKIGCGSNADDLADYRPGREAVLEEKVLEPLLDADMNKQDIRKLSAQFGLSTADMPSNPCLLSRVPYGMAASEPMLRQIEGGEAILKSYGFDVCRFRHYGNSAKVEIAADKLAKCKQIWGEIEPRLLALGFEKIILDERGFRSGSLNEAIK